MGSVSAAVSDAPCCAQLCFSPPLGLMSLRRELSGGEVPNAIDASSAI